MSWLAAEIEMKANLSRADKGGAALAWASWVMLAVYCAYVLLGSWSQFTDLETTVRLVGPDVGCSLSAISCSGVRLAIGKIAGVAVLAVAIGALFVPKRGRDTTVNITAFVAPVHLISLRLLFSVARGAA